MRKKTKILIGFYCLTVALSSCTPLVSRISQKGVEQVGPSGYGFQNPVWSPDGTKIVVTTQSVVHSWTSEIFVIDVLTGKKKSIMNTDNGSVMAISWSPNGDQILLSSEKGGDWSEGIWTFDADGGTTAEFLTDGYDAAWSPDGKYVAVILLSREKEYWVVKLGILDINTKIISEILVAKEEDIVVGDVNWSPSGKQLIFHYGQPGVGNIDLYILSIAGREITKITAGDENYSPSWNPGGNLIVYLNDLGKGYDPTLIVADKNNTCQQNLLTLDDLRWPSWSPDGKYVAFISHGELYLLTLDKFPSYELVCP